MLKTIIEDQTGQLFANKPLVGWSGLIQRVEAGDLVRIDKDEGKWSLVRTEIKPAAVDNFPQIEPGWVQGWLKTELLTDWKPNLEPIDLDAFTFSAVHSARAKGTVAQYLLACAQVESGITNKQNGAVMGPFQFRQETWADYLKLYQENGFTLRDIVNPHAQCFVAAVVAREGVDRLADPKTGIGKIPTAAQVYLTHFLGEHAAAAVLKNAESQPIDQLLIAYYKATPAHAHDAETFVQTKIIEANASLLKGKTLGGVLDEVARRLSQGLTRANELLDKFYKDRPEEAPATVGTAPWMAVAKGEQNKDTVERPGGAATNPEIDKYFPAVGLGGHHDDTAWCAAFVGYCMSQVAAPIVQKTRPWSSFARDWRDWGKPIEGPVVGAVAVTKPLAADTTGHVGFVDSVGADGTINLLAGNQGNPNCVCVRPLDKGLFVAFRWLDT